MNSDYFPQMGIQYNNLESKLSYNEISMQIKLISQLQQAQEVTPGMKKAIHTQNNTKARKR